MGPILVFGHKNPDNDSIGSAVAYAHLKNLTDAENVYVPARLGTAPRETVWVFERFGVELPEEIAHVRTRVRDVMTPDPVTIGAERADAGRGPRSCASAACAACRSSTAKAALVGLVERACACRALPRRDRDRRASSACRSPSSSSCARSTVSSSSATPTATHRRRRAHRRRRTGDARGAHPARATPSSSATGCARSRSRSRPARRA